MRFWTWTGAKYQNREKTAVSCKSSVALKTTGDQVASLLGNPGSTPELALTEGPAAASGSARSGAPQPSLQELVKLAGESTSTPAPKPKAKTAKSKPKPAPGQVTQSTPEEHRKNSRA